MDSMNSVSAHTGLINTNSFKSFFLFHSKLPCLIKKEKGNIIICLRGFPFSSVRLCLINSV